MARPPRARRSPRARRRARARPRPPRPAKSSSWKCSAHFLPVGARRGARGRSGPAPGRRRSGIARRRTVKSVDQLERAGRRDARRRPEALGQLAVADVPCRGPGVSPTSTDEVGLERRGVRELRPGRRARRPRSAGGRPARCTAQHPELPLLVAAEQDPESADLGLQPGPRASPGRRRGRARAPPARSPSPRAAPRARRTPARSRASSSRPLGERVHVERRQADQLGRIHRDEELLGHGQGDRRHGPAGQRVHQGAPRAGAPPRGPPPPPAP